MQGGDLNELMGKTIKQVRMSQDGTRLVFETDDGPVKYEAYGDCCSVSWIEHIDNVSALVGGKVEFVDDSDGGCEEIDGGALKTYFYKIRNQKGFCTIDMRNESNGYYGGSLIIDRTREEVECKEITADF